MPDPIRRLVTWARLFLKPRGAHRRSAAPPPHLPAPLLWTHAPFPPHRSPYGSEAATPLDATATRPVRPYLAAHEQRQRHHWPHFNHLSEAA
ncbi:hypothetical protein [Streptomyces sp. bgisy153]|uniref:hypothetical protein n=1 Tax=Streptomyces sp. bgisy153 TaxID=3413793 RepID=UPI003D7410F2